MTLMKKYQSTWVNFCLSEFRKKHYNFEKNWKAQNAKRANLNWRVDLAKNEFVGKEGPHYRYEAKKGIYGWITIAISEG